MALTESLASQIGTLASNFDLSATDGKNYSLDSFKESKALVVVFTCNHCPYAKAAWPILTKLANEYRNLGVAFVGINPNDETQYPEDSFEVMKQRVKDWKINFPYLRDEAQEVTRAYGAVCTPDVFVYDKNRKLYYRGRINNNWPPVEKVDGVWKAKEASAETKEELKEVLNSLLDGSPAPEVQYPSLGCSIKWKTT